jgi:hypothetical protein
MYYSPVYVGIPQDGSLGPLYLRERAGVRVKRIPMSAHWWRRGFGTI